MANFKPNFENIGAGGELNAAEEAVVQGLNALATSPAGQFIRKTSVSEFVNATPSDVASLAGLTDVTITLPVNTNILKYNGIRWVNTVDEGIISLGGLRGLVQTFANDTNVTISSVGTVHTLGWTGILSVARGGTALASGTSGGILGYTATGTLASSILLTANALVLGGGAGATPTPLGSLGTTTTVLHGNAAGAPTFSAVSLTADVSGILPTASGGTGIAFFTAAGPTIARIYTFPDAAATIAVRADNLSVFASTTSLQLLGVISDETGTGVLVFGTSPTFTTQITTPSIITAAGALGITPASGSNLNVTLATTGDFAVNTNQLYVDTSAGNVGIGTTTFGTSAVTVFSIANGTAPTTGPADTVQFFSTDDAAANTIPSFFCEGTNVLATGQADSVSSVRVKMRINGTVVTLLAV
jgi:hypothetical protein